MKTTLRVYFQTGDQILSINDIPIEECTHAETVDLLRTCEEPVVLEVVQGKNWVNIYNVHRTHILPSVFSCLI